MNENLVINIHDTYYVIKYKHAFVLFGSIFFLAGFFYLIFDFFKIQLFPVLSLIHVYGSLIFISLILYYLNREMSMESIKRFAVIDTVDYNFRTIISLFIFAGLQLLFVLNLFISITKKLSISGTQ
jgi:heme/copper-type cytochrome/quinol oxidase subunit 1